jgi:hypothetical protein
MCESPGGHFAFAASRLASSAPRSSSGFAQLMQSLSLRVVIESRFLHWGQVGRLGWGFHRFENAIVVLLFVFFFDFDAAVDTNDVYFDVLRWLAPDRLRLLAPLSDAILHFGGDRLRLFERSIDGSSGRAGAEAPEAA